MKMIKFVTYACLSAVMLFSAMAKASQPYADQVPANSVFYYGFSVSPDAPLDRRMLKQSLRDLQQINWSANDDWHDLFRITERLLVEVTQHSEGFGQRYGAAATTDIAFYLDGAFPVAQFNVQDPEQFMIGFSQLMAELGYADKLKDKGYAYWQLNEVMRLWLQIDGVEISLAMAPAMLANKRLDLLLAKQTESDSIGDAWQDYNTPYVDNKTSELFWLNLYEMAKTWARLGDQRMASDLSYVPYIADDFYSQLSLTCNEELVELASGIPYFAIHSVASQVDDGIWQRQHEGLFALTNARLSSLLSLYNGHLMPTPEGDPALHVALGININNIPAIYNGLANLLGEQHFECPALQQMQQDILGADRSTLAALNLAQGLQGASLTLFNLMGDDASGIQGLDALVTVSSSMVELNELMMQSMSPNGELGIPPENALQSAKVITDLWPSSLWGRFGNHFVAVEGPKAAHAAAQLADVPLNDAGLMSFSIDLQKLFDWSVNEGQLQGMMQPLMQSTEDGAGACELAAIDLLSSFGEIGFMEGQMKTGTDGLLFSSKEQVPMSSMQWQPINQGLYQVEWQGEDCQWEIIGTEQLLADKRIYTASNNECAVYEDSSPWQQYGYRLLFNDVIARSRENCDSEWQTVTVGEEFCVILSQTPASFTCTLNNTDGQVGIMRYRLVSSL